MSIVKTKCKRWVSSKTSREKSSRVVTMKNFISCKWPQANPNPNPSPKLSPRVRVGLTAGKTLTVENLKPNGKDEYRQTFREKPSRLVRMKRFVSWKWPSANLKPNPKLSPRVRVGLTPGKTMSVENLKPNSKDEYRQRLLRKNLQELWQWKILYPASDPKLTLTLTLALSLALGLGLGLTPGKTMSVENLKPNAKDEYRQRLLGKNLPDLWEWKILYPGGQPELSLTPTLCLALGLGLAWGHLQDIKFFILKSLEGFSLEVFDDSHLLHLVLDSQCLSFSQQLTPTLTLGLCLGLGLGLGFRVRVRVSLGSLGGYKIFHCHNSWRFFPRSLWRYSSFATKDGRISQ